VQLGFTSSRRWRAYAVTGALILVVGITAAWLLVKPSEDELSAPSPSVLIASAAQPGVAPPRASQPESASASESTRTAGRSVIASQPVLTETWRLDQSRVVSKGQRIPGPDGEVLQGVVVESRASLSGVANPKPHTFRVTYTVAPSKSGERVVGSWTLAPTGSVAARHAAGVVRGGFECAAPTDGGQSWSVPIRIIGAPSQFIGGAVQGQFKGSMQFVGVLVLPASKSAAEVAVRN